jgi:hypothetical protein
MGRIQKGIGQVYPAIITVWNGRGIDQPLVGIAAYTPCIFGVLLVEESAIKNEILKLAQFEFPGLGREPRFAEVEYVAVKLWVAP